MVIPAVPRDPTGVKFVYFLACGETAYITAGLATSVVSHVPGTASPEGAMMSADTKYAGTFTPAESIGVSDLTAQAFASLKSFLINPLAKGCMRSGENWRQALGAAFFPHEAPRIVTSATTEMRPAMGVRVERVFAMWLVSLVIAGFCPGLEGIQVLSEK